MPSGQAQAYQSVSTNDWNQDESYHDGDSDDKTLTIVDPPLNPSRSNRRSIFSYTSLSRTCLLSSIIAALLTILTLAALGYYSYKTSLIDGQSPPWYPSPLGGTIPSWQASYEKAAALVNRMSLVEKVNITTGTGWSMDLCVGNTGSAPSVGFPQLCLQDGPLGIRFVDHADSFPAGITVGSTWSKRLMRQRGAAHGREARLKGVNVLLGPSMGPLGRNPAGGRNWEGFGADPVLQGIAAAETIRGIQSQGVQATAKHFVGNEQEHFRKPFDWGLPEALSSNIDDRTLHEIYAWPFAESVKAGVASVMCSYQMVNNSYACQNSWLLNGVLKDELAFQGYVQSDWLAQRSGVASALAGLDMSMPGDGLYWEDGNSLFGEQLTIAVLNGSVPVERLDDMALRIVAAWYQVGQDKWDEGGPNFSSWTDEKVGKIHQAAADSDEMGEVNQFIEASSASNRAVARKVAAEGIVLLKNVDDVLPLSADMPSFELGRKARIAIIGEDAAANPKGPNACADRGCNEYTLAAGWGSGASEFPYLVDPYTALTRAFDTEKVEVVGMLDNELSAKDKDLLKSQDVCVVFANSDSGEGYITWNKVRSDRNGLELQENGVQLIKAVSENCGGSVVVIIHTVGPVIVEEFVDLPNVKAIVNANLPGQESGNALVDVLFGHVDASGRLAYTMGKSLLDYGPTAPVLYYPNHVVPQVDFSEGLYIDYRYFDKKGIEPRYEFGYGLSYTTFEYQDLELEVIKPKSALPDARPEGINAPVLETRLPNPQSALLPIGFRRLSKYVYPWITSVKQIRKGKYPYPVGYGTEHIPSSAGGAEGGNPSLYEHHVKLTVNLMNTGNRAGKEVIQVYVSFPENVKDTASGEMIDMPIKVLRAFEKVRLEAGESGSFELFLTRKDLSYWSVVQQTWVMPVEGHFTIRVGSSSRNLSLSAEY